jgi:hypothetical protein
MPRNFSRQIDPIPEYETDVLPHPSTTGAHATHATRHSPSPTSASSANRASTKRFSNPTGTSASKPDDFVLIPEHVGIDKSLPAGHHTSFAQLSRDKRVIKEQHRTLSEGIL